MGERKDRAGSCGRAATARRLSAIIKINTHPDVLTLHGRLDHEDVERRRVTASSVELIQHHAAVGLRSQLKVAGDFPTEALGRLSKLPTDQQERWTRVRPTRRLNACPFRPFFPHRVLPVRGGHRRPATSFKYKTD